MKKCHSVLLKYIAKPTIKLKKLYKLYVLFLVLQSWFFFWCKVYGISAWEAESKVASSSYILGSSYSKRCVTPKEEHFVELNLYLKNEWYGSKGLTETCHLWFLVYFWCTQHPTSDQRKVHQRGGVSLC